MAPLTGGDVAAMHRMADSLEWDWVCAVDLPDEERYRLDYTRRLIYLNAVLYVEAYYDALRAAFTEITRASPDATVVALRPYQARRDRTATTG